MPISPQLLPRPGDWSPSVHLTGSWTPKAAAAAEDPELEDFMARGDFIYAGFGSMKAGDARQRGRAVMGAALRTGLNVLVVTGSGELEVPARAGDAVLVRESVPHDRVLPRARAGVQHGGARTGHAVARASIPSVVVPFIGDQLFWGKLPCRRGLAARPIPYRKLDEVLLLHALDRTKNCGDHARRTGERIRSENGVAVSGRKDLKR
jgi:sterol 3beta-glucosyltransferase